MVETRVLEKVYEAENKQDAENQCDADDWRDAKVVDCLDFGYQQGREEFEELPQERD